MFDLWNYYKNNIYDRAWCVTNACQSSCFIAFYKILAFFKIKIFEGIRGIVFRNFKFVVILLWGY
jgi:hypothetical protein